MRGGFVLLVLFCSFFGGLQSKFFIPISPLGTTLQKVGIQIGHAGRKASSKVPWASKKDTEMCPSSEGGWPDQVWAPSAIPWAEHSCKPKEMTLDQIAELISAFGDAAVRAQKIGYDFVELHGAHGYLLHEFLSPVTNKRSDAYGGSLESRSRLLFEIVSEIRKRVGSDFPLGIRFSCTDYIDSEPSLKPEDVAEVAAKLVEAPFRLCFIDCSSGAIDPKQKLPRPFPLGYQVPFAKIVKSRVGSKAKVTAVGLIVDPQQIEDLLLEGSVDAVSLAKQFLREPGFTWRAANALNGGQTPYPKEYAWSVGQSAPPPYKKDSAMRAVLPLLGALAIGAFIGAIITRKSQ